MEVVYFPDDPRPPRWMSPVLALGNFDGLHRGHQKIVERIQRSATDRGATALVLTFDPHPPRVVRPDKAPPLLMTMPQKLAALERAGLHGTAVVRFTEALSRWSPEQFVRHVLVDWLRVSEVWVGADFLFGHERAGTFTVLRILGQQYGFKAEKIDPVRYKEFVVSSTRIRRLVAEGRVDKAGALLGHHYTIEGVVSAGAGRGRTLGFPTANLSTDNELVPPTGVYATTADLNGTRWPAVTNIGVRPTFEAAAAVTVETHVLGLEADVYGARLSLNFIQRLRDERKFPDVDALREQIAADVRRAGRLFDKHLGMTMTPRAFEFSMQVSSGRAMLGAVRDLASQVATYAGGQALAAAVADEVVTAAEAAIAAGRGDGTPIDVLFKRSDEYLDVFVSGGRATTLAAAPLSRGHGLSVDWLDHDGRPVCHIRQAMA